MNVSMIRGSNSVIIALKKNVKNLKYVQVIFSLTKMSLNFTVIF